MTRRTLDRHFRMNNFWEGNFDSTFGGLQWCSNPCWGPHLTCTLEYTTTGCLFVYRDSHLLLIRTLVAGCSLVLQSFFYFPASATHCWLDTTYFHTAPNFDLMRIQPRPLLLPRTPLRTAWGTACKCSPWFARTTTISTVFHVIDRVRHQIFSICHLP